jgi:hypothetical protein
MSREVCFLITTDGVVAWSDASESSFALPDSRPRWEAIWNLRDRLDTIAHSHPGGPLAFSYEDTTTMDALDSALGKAMRYAVVAPNGIVVRDVTGTRVLEMEPAWAEALRQASGMR